MIAGSRRTAYDGARAVIAGFVALGCSVGTRVSYGVMLVGLADKLDEPVGLVALGLAAHWLVFMFSAPLAWRIYVRVGARWMVGVGGLLCGLSLALLPVAPNLITALLIFGGLSGLGSHGLGHLVSNQPVIAVVPAGASRDRAFALIACGAPVGTAVLPAMATLVVDRVSWIWGCAFLGIAITALSATATWISVNTHASGPRPRVHSQAQIERGRPPWMDRSFMLLAAGFGSALLVQSGVPFILPVWGTISGRTADEIALAFVIIGLAGIAGRLLVTSHRRFWGLRLWIVIPTALLGVLGFVLAGALSHVPLWFYIAVGILGASTQLIGAMFAIATLACFPEKDFAHIAGTLLVPIGLAAGIASLLPGVLVDSNVDISTIMFGLGSVSLIGALAVQSAEFLSPEFRARRRHDRLAADPAPPDSSATISEHHQESQ